MTTGRCQRVVEALLEGDYDHDHLAGCSACRRAADVLLAVETGLTYGPAPAPAPDLVPILVERIAARRRLRSAALATGAVAAGSLLAAMTVVWIAGAIPDAAAAAGAQGGSALTGLFGPGPGGGLSWMPLAVSALYAVGIALMVRVAAVEI